MDELVVHPSNTESELVHLPIMFYHLIYRSIFTNTSGDRGEERVEQTGGRDRIRRQTRGRQGDR